MAPNEKNVYAGRVPGKPGYCCIMADVPERKRETAKEIAKWIREGLEIERVTVEEARAGFSEWIDHRTKEKKSCDQQTPLF